MKIKVTIASLVEQTELTTPLRVYLETKHPSLMLTCHEVKSFYVHGLGTEQNFLYGEPV